ncbi:MAG: DUF1513 domain-containing protein [Paracoccaceae bacterium]
MPTRRGFLASLAAISAAPAPSWADASAPDYLAAAQVRDGSYRLYGLDAAGAPVFWLELPDRGHAAAAHPTRPEAVAFARRPGDYAIVLDCARGEQVASLTAPEGRHFYGHGAFSEDGALLYTAENDFDAGLGRVGIWSVDEGYRRVGEFGSGGVGPHDIVRMPGGGALVVANGGIATHPDTGRAKLNLPTMKPNLTYLDADGDILEVVEAAESARLNSIRHLAVRPDGLVAFAMQWEGDIAAAPPLLGLHRRGSAAAYLVADGDGWRDMRGYAGSVAFSGDGALVAITSPEGGAAQVFDVETGALSAAYRIADVCGVAPADDHFLFSSGSGWIGDARRGGGGDETLPAWDNHLVTICALA